MKKLTDLADSLNEAIIKYWFWLHIVFIIFYVAGVAYKVMSGTNALGIEKPNEFNYINIVFVVVGFILITVPFVLFKLKVYLLYIIAFVAYLMISFGHIRTVDKDLNWEGSDVAWGNYDAAVEFNQFGILQGIKDWNERANPANPINSIDYSDSVKTIFHRHNLNWLTFDKWKTEDVFDRYKAWNNRPLMHPPLAPIVLSLWLKLFPFGRWSAEISMILMEFASILLLFIFIGKKVKNQNWMAVLLLAFLTTPVMIRFHNPSSEQLSMLLFLLSTYFLFDTGKYSPGKFYLSGLLIGMAFFTKFIIVFYITLQVLFLIFHYQRVRFTNLVAYLLGILSVVCVFTLFGYYFWLTILTGIVNSEIYEAHNPVTLLLAFSKIVFFGPTIILLVLLLISDFNKYANKTLLVSVLLSLAVTMLYLWEQGTWNRYLVFYLPVLCMFLLISKREINFKTKDILIIPITNFIFIVLNISF